MNKPVLVVMAAGMGSRFGGLKQIEPVDEANRGLIDYSLYDSLQAGFERAVFVIREDFYDDFREKIGRRAEKRMDVSYAFQRMDALPAGFTVPEGRVKPWGTAYAVLAAKPYLNTSFVAINADDFYGRGAYKTAYDFLISDTDNKRSALVGYEVGNTLTENGHVKRGVCKVLDGKLVEIIERTHIEKHPEGAAYTEDGKTFTVIPHDTVVSMNFWCFKPGVLDELEARFEPWLREAVKDNPTTCEYYISTVLNEMIRDGAVEFKVLPSVDKWYGVTYAEDMPALKAALKKMREEGCYPEGSYSEELPD